MVNHHAFRTSFALASVLAAACNTFHEEHASVIESALAKCKGSSSQRELVFSANALPDVPESAAFVWGGNATEGADALYSSDFLSRAKEVHAVGAQVFAYLEGPCGDTAGEDDGERTRCADIHNAFNAANAPDTTDSPEERWKPFTFEQLKRSGASGVDFCEIDNLENNVTIDLNPLLSEIKSLYDNGDIHCKLVLKNVNVDAMNAIRSDVASSPSEANFIAPFHIFEAGSTDEKAALDEAMVKLKGEGAVVIISTDTKNYGSAFTQDSFLTCK
jgi:hypothetical protein